MKRGNQMWVVRVEGRGYAAARWFGSFGEVGRPVVKTREKAWELDDDEVRKHMAWILNVLRSVGVCMSQIKVVSADPQKEEFLRLAGWWDLFDKFAEKK